VRTCRALPLLAGLFLGSFSPWRPATAQQAALRGVVVDSAGAPIPQADIGIVALHRLTRSDDQGRFSLNKLKGDTVELSVRRLGYEPRVLRVALDTAPDSVHIVMKEQPEILSEMSVSAHMRRLRLGVEEFYRRRALGTGTYFTREDIQARHAHSTSDILRNTPGVRFVRTSSGLGVRFANTSIVRRDCMPMIWIDGQKAPAMEVDDIPVNDIEAIELYSGASTTPYQFAEQMRNSSCGTIAVWSRVPGS
jgi:carboxypeptidase family protein/TonB-dependent receptor-like protein